jgi:hypothetical protein
VNLLKNVEAVFRYKDQVDMKAIRCGHTENADANAPKNSMAARIRRVSLWRFGVVKPLDEAEPLKAVA